MISRFINLQRRSSVLILVLWMVIILGMLVLSYTFSVRTQTQITAASRNRREAYWAARAGIDKLRAVLLTVDMNAMSDHTPPFTMWGDFHDQKIGEAWFSVDFYDEASRVNINGADEKTLMLMPGMTISLAHALLDWRDSDKRPRSSGAEDEYYQSLPNPIRPRNAPLMSDRELQKVKGWDRVFYAAYPDAMRKALLPDESEPFFEEDSETESEPLTLDSARMLLGMMTVWSTSSADLAPDGQPKMQINDVSDGQMLRRMSELSEEEAKAIETARKQKNFSQVTDLLDVMATPAPVSSSKSPTPTPRPGSRSSSSRSSSSSSRSSTSTNSSGSPSNSEPQKVFSLERVGQIIDYFTVNSSSNSSSGAPAPGLVNINTAGREVLMTLPDMTPEMADAIVQEREVQPYTSAGMIASVPGMTEAIFKKVYPLVMSRSSRFHVWGHGWAGGTGPDTDSGVTIEAVLDVGADFTDIVYWKER